MACASRRWRNGGSDLPLLEPAAQTVGGVSLVRQQALWLSDGAEKRNGHDHVGDVSGGQCESDRSAAIIGQSINLARPSAPRAADRFFKLPFFEPLAERWALTWPLSIESRSGMGPAAGRLLEDALPDTTLRPAIVTVVERCRRPVDGWNVTPSTACLQDMQDAQDDRAVVDARLTRPAAWQVRAQRLPRRIRQPQ